MRSSIYNQARFQKIRYGYNRFPPLPLHFSMDSLVQVWICLVVDIFMGSSLIVKTELIPSRWRLHMLIGLSSKAQKISSVHSPQARLLSKDNDPSLYSKLPLSSCSLIFHSELTYPSLFLSLMSRCNSPALFGGYCESHLDPW